MQCVLSFHRKGSVFFSITKQRKKVLFPSLLPEPLALSSNLCLSNLDLELEKDR